MKKALLFLSLCSQAWSLSCSTPVTLSKQEHNNYWPQVSVNEKGDALAVWIAANEETEEEVLFAATKDADKKWSSAPISKPEKDIYLHPIFVDPQGDSYALWEVENINNAGDKLNFYQFAKKQKSKAWSSGVNLSDSEDALQFARSAFDAKGNALLIGAAKVQEPNSTYAFSKTKAVIYHCQTGKKIEAELAKDAVFTSGEQLVTNKQGKVFAFWQEYHSKYERGKGYQSEWVKKGSWLQDDASWSKPVVIYNFKGSEGNILATKGALNSKGDLALLWVRSDSKDSKRLQVVTCRDQKWSEPLDLAVSKQNFSDLRIAMNDAEDVVVGWIATEKGKDIAYAAQKSKAESWSTPLALSHVDKNAQGLKIALDNEGNILAIWSAKEGRKQVLQTAYQPKGQSWTSPISLSNKENDCEKAKVRANETGHFVVLWGELQKKRSSVHGATLSVETQEWSYALLSPTGQDCGDFEFALNKKGEGIVAWQIIVDEDARHIQTAELKVN